MSSTITALRGSRRGRGMQVVDPICCGINVYQACLTACLRQVHDDSQVTTEVREFATTYEALLALSDWLAAQPCPVMAIESTGVYTPPGLLPIVGALSEDGGTEDRRTRKTTRMCCSTSTRLTRLRMISRRV